MLKKPFFGPKQSFGKNVGKVKPKPLFWGSSSTVRNYFAIAFTCVYLVLTVGVAKTTHYCMGRLNQSDLFSFTTKKCRCSVFLKASAPCCKDEHELIVIDNDQNQEVVLSANAPGFFEIGTLFTESLLHTAAIEGDNNESFFSDSSPPPPKPLFKLHCSLVFYS